MKQFLYAALCAALLPFATHAANFLDGKPDWYACSASEECIILTGVCGSPTAVNRKHKDAFEAYVDSILADCMNTIVANQKDLKPICQNKTCIVDPKPIYLRADGTPFENEASQ